MQHTLHIVTMSTPSATIQIEVFLDPNELPEQTRKDLEANAHLKRTTPAKLLADIIQKKLREPFIVKPKAA